MINIAQKTLEFYIKNNKKPTLDELGIDLTKLPAKNMPLFVTLFENGKIRGGAGSVKELKTNIGDEIISNTLSAIEDERFDDISDKDLKKIKIRIDIIEKRELINNMNDLNKINPVKKGIIAIKADNSALAVILPNISTQINSGKDFMQILVKKLGSDLIENDYLYAIETNKKSNF